MNRFSAKEQMNGFSQWLNCLVNMVRACQLDELELAMASERAVRRHLSRARTPSRSGCSRVKGARARARGTCSAQHSAQHSAPGPLLATWNQLPRLSLSLSLVIQIQMNSNYSDHSLGISTEAFSLTPRALSSFHSHYYKIEIETKSKPLMADG